MDWNQIENKWAAMTRRVRADWSMDDPADTRLSATRRISRTDPRPEVFVDQKASVLGEARAKMPSE